MTSISEVAPDVITLPHGKVRYGGYGSGFPMLLISGFGWGSWTYEHVIEPLAEHYHVYLPEPPGFHGSDRPNDWYRMEDFSEGLVAFMDALGIQ